jgi:hypothetical protein
MLSPATSVLSFTVRFDATGKESDADLLKLLEEKLDTRFGIRLLRKNDEEKDEGKDEGGENEEKDEGEGEEDEEEITDDSDEEPQQKRGKKAPRKDGNDADKRKKQVKFFVKRNGGGKKGQKKRNQKGDPKKHGAKKQGGDWFQGVVGMEVKVVKTRGIVRTKELIVLRDLEERATVSGVRILPSLGQGRKRKRDGNGGTITVL